MTTVQTEKEMSANKKMKAALRQYVVPELRGEGFTGTFPHFRKVQENRIELLCFQWNTWGNSFTVEVSVVFTDRQGLSANFTTDAPRVSHEEATVWNTNQRFRLKGNYNGWFYYSDLYCSRFWFRKHFRFCSWKHYHDVGEKEAASYIPKPNERLIQKADEDIYRKVCGHILRQMPTARRWWKKMNRHRSRYLP